MDVDLLIKRLAILGLPSDVIRLIKVLLQERYFYVSIIGADSAINESLFFGF